MKRVIFTLLLILSLMAPVLVHADPAPPAERLAECDLCGYCPDKGYLPQNWPSCAKCLYKDVVGDNPDATRNDTIRIDPDTNAPPPPTSGHHYTMIGCLSTDLQDFTSPGAAGNVTQVLLTLLFRVAGGIAFLYLIYGAFLIATSQSDPEKLNYGRRVIIGAVIGLAFSLSSLLIINILASQILKLPGFNP